MAKHTPAPPLPRVSYSPAEVAAMTSMSTQHVLNLIHAGVIPVVRAGRRVLITQQALDKFLGTATDT